MLQKYKNAEDCIKLLTIGMAGIVLYKIWKKLSMALPLFGTDDLYIFSQSAFTIYRIFATILGLFLIKKYYSNYKKEFQFDNFLIFNLFIVLPIYFFTRYLIFNFKFSINIFLTEIPFNFFTGTFEEIFFRALIMIGLLKFMKPIWAILTSALIFSLWHYDVILYWPDYFLIFLWGVYAGLCYQRGASLLSLSLFHFLWDQVFFGFYWEIPPGVSINKLVAVLAISEIILLILVMGLVFFKTKNNNIGTKYDELKNPQTLAELASTK